MDLKGAMTVETALIFPIVFFLVMILVLFMLRLYDRNILQIAACQGAMQSFYANGESNRELEKICTTKAEEVLAKELAFTKDVHIETKVTKGKVSVRAYGKPEWMLGNGERSETFLPKPDASWTFTRINPAGYIHGIRTIERIKEKVQEKKEEHNKQSENSKEQQLIEMQE